MINKFKKKLIEDYFYLRNYEYAQYLYDIAYIDELKCLSNNTKISKYRIKSLMNAAFNIDGYSNSIYRWLNDEKDTNNLISYQPSHRIKKYLVSLQLGNIDQILHHKITSTEIGCLRLRSIRGVRKKYLTDIINADDLSPILTDKIIDKLNVTRKEIIETFKGNAFGQWQTAHIVPPLLRFLNTIELEIQKKIRIKIIGIDNAISPVISPIKIEICSSNFNFDKINIEKISPKNPLFFIKKINKSYRIQHIMGWYFEILKTVNKKRNYSIIDLALKLDPLLYNIPNNIKSDLHLHSNWSDGITSIRKLVEQAKKNRFDYIAITDHSRSSKFQNGLTPSAWIRQAINISKINFNILHGLEVDILKDGELDFPNGILDGMDLIIGSVHTGFNNSLTQNMSRLTKAIESGRIDIIGHPTASIIGRPGLPNYFRPPMNVNWDKIFKLCLKWNVAIEINCFPSRLDISSQLLDKVIKIGCWVSLGSDSHSDSHMELIKFGINVLKKVKTPNVLNTFSFEELKEWIKKAREKRKNIPKTKEPSIQLELFSDILNKKKNTFTPIKVHIREKEIIPDGSDVIGIDITASKNKKSGIAFLSGRHVQTESLSTDEEIIEYIKMKKPSIVSIDSPLGLPGGKNEIDNQAGIVRVAEKHLSSVGIAAYPALIDSMKNLTIRGIKLRKIIESFTFPPTVIESYPGAAQDILCIPRKQNGLENLREGIKELALYGTGLETKSHDEMDAITCCIVGRYYEKGMYEAMGIPSEAQLIVPKTITMSYGIYPVICLSGKSGVGKSVVARYLSLFYGFNWIKTNKIIYNLIESNYKGISSKLEIKKNSPITAEQIMEFGRIILEEFNQAPIMEQLIKKITSYNGPIIIDSIRDIRDLKLFNEKKKKLIIWYVNCSDNIRRMNLLKRNNGKPKEISTYNNIDQRVENVRSIADACIFNTGTLENLKWKVDDILFNKILSL